MASLFSSIRYRFHEVTALRALMRAVPSLREKWKRWRIVPKGHCELMVMNAADLWKHLYKKKNLWIRQYKMQPSNSEDLETMEVTLLYQVYSLRDEK